jgi:dihydrofolate reductase
MRRLFLQTNVSLDGHINDTAGDIDWHFADEEFQRYIDQTLESIDGMLFGRLAFERLAAYWPTAGPEATTTQKRRMHELPKYVLSRSLTQSDWHNSHVLGGDVAAAIALLEQQDGRDLALFAGGHAATSAVALGAIDALRIIVNPRPARRRNPPLRRWILPDRGAPDRHASVLLGRPVLTYEPSAP